MLEESEFDEDVPSGRVNVERPDFVRSDADLGLMSIFVGGVIGWWIGGGLWIGKLQLLDKVEELIEPKDIKRC